MTVDQPRYSAAIFDLDGVIADTARLHFAAWERLAADEGFQLPEDAHDRLKGVDRMASLAIVLEGSSQAYTEEEKVALANRKNLYYQQSINSLTPADLLPGAARVLSELNTMGVPLALASASKNAQQVLAALGISGQFAFIADAATIINPKPHPEIFLAAAAGLARAPSECIGIEDAAAGVESIKAAGMFAIGVGEADSLARADSVIASLEELMPTHYFAR